MHGNRSRTRTNQSFGFCTTTVINTVGCPRWYTGAPLDTLVSEIVYKENFHGKHAQTQRMCRHGQDRCSQVPGMRARRARAGGGMARASKKKRYVHTKDFLHVGLWRHRFVLQVVFVEHAQCTEQSTRRGIVCGSPGVLPCTTGLLPRLLLSCFITLLAHLEIGSS